MALAALPTAVRDGLSAAAAAICPSVLVGGARRLCSAEEESQGRARYSVYCQTQGAWGCLLCRAGPGAASVGSSSADAEHRAADGARIVSTQIIPPGHARGDILL